MVLGLWRLIFLKNFFLQKNNSVKLILSFDFWNLVFSEIMKYIIISEKTEFQKSKDKIKIQKRIELFVYSVIMRNK